MKSCVFGNLPLVEVSTVFRLAFDEVPNSFDLSFSKAEEVRKTLEPHFPHVTGSKLGNFPGPFVANELKGLLLSTKDEAVTLFVTNALIEAKFTNATGKYPGFQFMLDSLKSAWNAVGNPKVEIVAIAYTNLDRSGKKISQMILPHGFAVGGLDDYIELNVVRRLGSLEHRIQCREGDENMRLLVSTAGQRLAEGDDPISVAENNIHDPMQDLFASMLTEEAKSDWNYEGIA